MSGRSARAIALACLAAATMSACGGAGGSGDATPAGTGTGSAQTGPAGAFRSLDFAVSIEPPTAGSEDQPQGVRLGLSLTLGKTTEDIEPPQVQDIDIDFPAGSAFHGDRHPACDEQTLGRGGPAGCPEGSVMGEGTLLALADTAESPGRITVVNGGKDRLYFWTELDRPARVEAAVVGTVTTEDGGGYRLALKIPDRLQVIAGVPIAMRKLEISGGGGDWLATTGCPDGHWTFKGSARFSDGSTVERTTEVVCE